MPSRRARAAITGALLYVPGDQADKLASARRLGAAVILDLEDSVAPSRKDVALETVAAALRAGPFASPPWVRLSGIEHAAEEVRTLAASGALGGVWVPKAERPEPLDDLAGVLPDEVLLGVLVESAAGVLEARTLASHPRVGLVQIGEVDLCAELGVDPLAAHVMDPYRSWVVAASAAAGLPAPIGPVWPHLGDVAGLHQSGERLRAQGFSGRACIHPAQIADTRAIFEPTPADVRSAEALLAEHHRQTTLGVGVYRGAGGEMVDAATIRRARAIVGGTRDDV